MVLPLSHNGRDFAVIQILFAPTGNALLECLQVVKSDSATVFIPELEFEIPAQTQKGTITTLEGLLSDASSNLAGWSKKRIPVLCICHCNAETLVPCTQNTAGCRCKSQLHHSDMQQVLLCNAEQLATLARALYMSKHTIRAELMTTLRCSLAA